MEIIQQQKDTLLSFIPLGGIGDVTKNMYLYEYKDEILIVDCGLGFADETMLGVDLLLPDISYLLQTKKKIVGMVITHGHEDHMGALPFILPQLPHIPVFATPFTSTLANEKLKEFSNEYKVQSVPFDNATIQIGSFQCTFIQVTHSVPDTSHIFIKTPAGNIYHGSDYKFDDTPQDGNKSNYKKIQDMAKSGVMCLMSDCLGSERSGRTPSETTVAESFIEEIKLCKGRFFVTTYSSHIARLNQIIAVSEQAGRKVCFVGRSLLKAKEAAKKVGYLAIKPQTEVKLEDLDKYRDQEVTLLVAGSQGQGSSALARIVNGEHREISLSPTDTVIFSSDPIPGNEVLVYELINSIAKQGARVIYPPLSRGFHVSGHGSIDEIKQLIDLVKPQRLVPIGGNFRHMVNYRNIAEGMGYKKHDVLLLDDGQEVIFSNNGIKQGRMIPVKSVYVDEVSGEELENFVLRDRKKLLEGGIVVVIAEIDSTNGQLVERPDVIIRGFALEEDSNLYPKITQDIKAILSGKKGKVNNRVYLRKLIGSTVEKRISRELRRNPLVLPVVVEV